jgi:hypothetical protein
MRPPPPAGSVQVMRVWLHEMTVHTLESPIVTGATLGGDAQKFRPEIVNRLPPAVET